MTLLTNSFEGGTSGTTLTGGSGGNTGGSSGNFADSAAHSSGTLQFSSAQAMHGSLSMVAATSGTATSECFTWSTSLGTVTTHYGRAYINLSAAPGSTDAIVEFENSSASWAGAIQLTTARQIAVQTASFATAGTFTTALATGTWYRIEWELVSSTTVGQIVVNLYVGDSATATETHTYSSQNFAANCGNVLFGWPSGQHASQPSLYFDDIGLSTTGFLGPATTSVTTSGGLALPPMAMAGSVSVPGSPVTTFGGLALPPMGFAGSASPGGAPTFPQAPLGATVELDLGGTWTDISGYTDYAKQDITLVRGHADESTTASPADLTLALTNTDARFSDTNPTGPYYGQIGRNTPVRLSLPAQTTYLRLEDDYTSGISTPDATALRITSDIDIRIDVDISGVTDSVLASKTSHSVTTGWILSVNDSAKVQFFWSTTGSDLLLATSTVPVSMGRQCIRVTLDVNNGAGGWTATFYTTAAGGADGSTWTQLGDPVIGSATTSIFGATGVAVTAGNYDPAVTSAAAMAGSYYEFELRSGIGGTVVCHPVFTSQTAGATSFTDAQSHTWTVFGTAQLTGRSYRAYLEAASWTPSSDETGKSVWSTLAASGILRRIQQGTKPLQSVFRRSLLSAPGLVGFWPCEDGNDTSGGGGSPATPTQFASAIPGVDPGIFSGSPQFASDSGFLCSYPIPVLSGSQWRFTLPKRSGLDTANVFRFLMHVPSGGDTNGWTIAQMNGSGTIAVLKMIYNTGGALTLTGYDSSGAQLFTTGAVAYAVNGQLLWTSIELQTVGSTVQYSVVTLMPGAAGAVGGTLGTVTGTIGNATSLQFDPGGALSGTAIGQVTYQTIWESLYDFAPQLDAYQGETAGNRFARLCAENGLAYRVYGPPNDTTVMGAQTPQSLTTLLQECADADRGQIYEPRQVLALGYRTRASMQQQAAAVTLDYSADDLAGMIESTEDDQYTINDATVTRAYTASGSAGSSSEVVVTDGPLSNQAPPNGVGDYLTSVTINLNTDSQAGDLAGWITWIGTATGPRYPSITYDLAKTGIGTLLYSLPAADMGDRLILGNFPAWLPPDGADQLIVQTTENIGEFTYTIKWCCVPGTPYLTGIFDDPVFGRADTDGSTLHTGISSSATSMLVDTTDPTTPIWTTAAADFPFDIAMGGERITVTNITGASSPQTFTITRSVNGVVKAHLAGEDVRLFFPTILSL